MLVSIVIPIYKPNTTYLRELFQSISNQTYRSFEVLVSDDNDDEQLLKSLFKEFPNVHFKYCRNAKEARGIFNNLNNAITESCGEYIQLFCQDDKMEPSFIDEQVRFIETHNVAMVFPTYYSLTSDSARDYVEELHQKKLWNYLPRVFAVNEAKDYFLRFGCFVHNLSPVMLQRSAIDEVGFFNQKFPYAGDFEYWVRLNSRRSMGFNNNKLLLLRTHNERASNVLSRISLIQEEQVVYKKILAMPPESGSRERLLLNKRGAQHLYYLLKNSFELKKDFWVGLKHLNTYPFSVVTSLFLLITTFNQRFDWVRKR